MMKTPKIIMYLVITPNRVGFHRGANLSLVKVERRRTITKGKRRTPMMSRMRTRKILIKRKAH